MGSLLSLGALRWVYTSQDPRVGIPLRTLGWGIPLRTLGGGYTSHDPGWWVYLS